MADTRRPQHRTRGPRALAAGLAALALVASACSGGGDGKTPAAARRGGTTTTTVQLQTSQIIGGGPVEEAGTSKFPIEGGELTVLVPEGAMSKGSRVEVREVTGTPDDLGAVQREGSAYEVSVKDGKILPNKQIVLQYTLDGPLPTTDPRPVGGVWDDGDKVWRPTNSDYDRSTTVSVFAGRPGTYSWLRWSWDKALQSGADAVRTIVGPVTPTAATVRCDGTDDLRTRVNVQSSTGNGLAWCVGKENNADIVRVRNIGQSPLAVRTLGLSTPSRSEPDPLLDRLMAAVGPVWTPQDGEDVRILPPGEELTYPITNASEKALLRAELNGFTQHYDVLAAAAAFAAGFHAGSAPVADAVLNGKPAVLQAVVEQLAKPGCLNGLGDVVSGPIYATNDLAAYAAALVLKCVDESTAELIAAEAPAATPLASLRSSFVQPAPAVVLQQIQPALRTALTPLVEPTGGPVAGELIITPKDGVLGTTPSLAPVGTAPPVTPTVAPTDTTVAAVGATSTVLVVGTTTVVTAPPVPGGTTTTTRAPATTTTTRPAATTTTTRATTTTTRAPTTTTTTTAPPLGQLNFTVNAAPCGMTGGTITGTGSNFRPGGRWSATFFSPNNAPVPGSGNFGIADSAGNMSLTFNCSTAPEPGTYRVEVAEDCPTGTPASQCRTPVLRSFNVNVYETRWATERTDLTICSGGTVLGTPGGTFEQTFVLGGTTISEVGFANREEFTGVLEIVDNPGAAETVLWRTSLVINGTDVRVGSIGLSGLTPGRTLTLRLTKVATIASAPNHALNFFYTRQATAASGQVTTTNECPWRDPVPGLGAGIPIPPAGADLIGWVAP